MTYKNFLREFIAPYVKPNDKPANRQLFNDTLDRLEKDGLVNKKISAKWMYPAKQRGE